MDKRICFQCKKPLVGRIDQRFCDAQCRNSFHNQHKRADEQYITQVSAAIRRNRRILKDLCPEGKATVRRDVLEKKGFDYRYFSGTYTSAKLTYYISFDYGFAAVTDQGKEKALIIQKQNYMDNYQLDPWKSVP